MTDNILILENINSLMRPKRTQYLQCVSQQPGIIAAIAVNSVQTLASILELMYYKGEKRHLNTTVDNILSDSVKCFKE